jgi:hypothetical protein
MRKHMICLAGFVLALSVAAAAQPLLSDPPKRFPLEIGLYGGFSLSQIKGTTNYQDQWGYNLLRNVNEQTAIATNAKTGFGGGGEISYYFSPNFGIQALFSYSKFDVPNTATCTFAWTWTDGTSYSKTTTLPPPQPGVTNPVNPGSFSSLPLSLNVVGRFGSGRLDAVFSAGATIFMNSFTQNSFLGYGVTTISQNPDSTYTQYVDALKVGLTIPSGAMKKTIFGANFGAGFTFMFSDMIGIRADVRYYYAPEQVLSWDFVLGNSDGVFFSDIKNEPFTADDIQLLKETTNTFTMRVNPSFIHITLGLVFSFGGGR